MEERLSKVIALTGVASRREADQAVLDGRVTVNGNLITEPGFRVNLEDDHVKLDGKLLNTRATPSYLVLNKPRGVLATRVDPEGRPTVVSLLRSVKGRLLPVGRLDWDDEGTLLLTSDAALAVGLSDPKLGIPKTYLIKVRDVPDESVLDRMRTGVALEGGRSLPLQVRIVSVAAKNAWLQVTVQEARPQLLKKMMLKLKHPLLKLKCIEYGPLSVKGLPPGTFRKLTEAEVAALQNLVENPPGLPSVIRNAGVGSFAPERVEVAEVPEQPRKVSRAVRAGRVQKVSRNEVARSRNRGRAGRS